MSARAVIFGCAGLTLGEEEKRFFADADPWGFILFGRNCADEAQIATLCADLRAAIGRNAPIFIDEEGGRVSRLRAIGGRIGPAAEVFARSGLPLEDQCQAVQANYAAIGARLLGMGIDADCAPVLDLPMANADPIISDRAFSTDPEQAAILGQACLDGLNSAGVAGVIKHIPGHGRADVDSHKALPVVSASREDLQAHDFEPFKRLKNAPMAMTAHVVYSAFDPDTVATCSRIMIDEIIRGQIGFDGLLMSDDLDMQALAGSLGERAEAVLGAGCDVVLQCSGALTAMREIMPFVPALAGEALRRADAARAGVSRMITDVAEAEAEAEMWLARITGTRA